MKIQQMEIEHKGEYQEMHMLLDRQNVQELVQKLQEALKDEKIAQYDIYFTIGQEVFDIN